MAKKLLIDKADRLYQIAPDIFSFTKSKEKPSLIKKTDLIDLGRFNWPGEFSDENSISNESLKIASEAKVNKLRESLADWFEAYYHIKLNPAKEIYVGPNISNMVFKTALAFIDNGDLVFIPKLGIPLYQKAATACGAEPVGYRISGKSNWQPAFDQIKTRLGRYARMLFVNSPHNPTGTVLDAKEMENLLWTASKENLVIVNDAAYHSLTTNKQPSLLSIKNGKKISLELYSFSYTFGLPSLPFGFAIGHRDLINGLKQTDQLMPVAINNYLIDCALDAIKKYPSENLDNIKNYFKKSETEAAKLMELLEIEPHLSNNIPFIWGRLNRRKSSQLMASQLYRRNRILTAPGIAFGNSGEGYLRFSLTASSDSYKKAADRIKKRHSLLKKGN